MPRRALTYRWYAKTYGWTQRQVDEEMSAEMADWYPLIEQAADRAAVLMEKQAKHEKRRPG
jgi:hypothetical protein